MEDIAKTRINIIAKSEETQSEGIKRIVESMEKSRGAKLSDRDKDLISLVYQYGFMDAIGYMNKNIDEYAGKDKRLLLTRKGVATWIKKVSR